MAILGRVEHSSGPGEPAQGTGHSLVDVPDVDRISLATSAYPIASGVEPLTGSKFFTEASVDSWLAAGLVVGAALYLYGVYRLRLRGDHWPALRTFCFLGLGFGSVAIVTLSGLHAYDTTVISVHMVQHMVLSMVAPIFLALGAPVTLALRCCPNGPRPRCCRCCTAGSPRW